MNTAAVERGGSVADARDETRIAAGPARTERMGGLGHPNRWAVLGLVALGTSMTTLDTSIVNISLPSIARTFQTPIGGAIEWVIIAYLTAVAATLLTFGRLSDAIGRKPVWEAGLATFTLGSVLCGAAGTLPMLIVARAFQGLGGALILAPSFAIITEAFSPVDRGRALGLNSAVIAIATSLGPTLGGLITAHLTWRWIFYVNVPLGVLGVLAARRLLPGSATRSREPLDGPGAGLLAVGLAFLTLSLSLGQGWGWASVRLLACVAAAVAALGVAVVVERRTPHPIVDFGLFQNRVLTSSLASMTLAMLALFAITFILPFYFEQLRGFSVEESGSPAHASPPHDHGDRAPERLAGRSLRFALARVERAGARLPGSRLAVPTRYRQHRRGDRRVPRVDRSSARGSFSPRTRARS